MCSISPSQCTFFSLCPRVFLLHMLLIIHRNVSRKELWHWVNILDGLSNNCERGGASGGLCWGHWTSSGLEALDVRNSLSFLVANQRTVRIECVMSCVHPALASTLLQTPAKHTWMSFMYDRKIHSCSEDDKVKGDSCYLINSFSIRCLILGIFYFRGHLSSILPSLIFGDLLLTHARSPQRP